MSATHRFFLLIDAIYLESLILWIGTTCLMHQIVCLQGFDSEKDTVAMKRVLDSARFYIPHKLLKIYYPKLFESVSDGSPGRSVP